MINGQKQKKQKKCRNYARQRDLDTGEGKRCTETLMQGEKERQREREREVEGGREGGRERERERERVERECPGGLANECVIFSSNLAVDYKHIVSTTTLAPT